MIVIEGMDNSGKSTLARAIAAAMNYEVQPSEGPPRHFGDLNTRIARYNSMKRVVFDRHPAVSNPIYDKTRAIRIDTVSPQLIDLFYNMRPLIVYCDPGSRGLDDHVVKKHDNVTHLNMIKIEYITLLDEYRQWAIDHAHFLYRIGDDMSRIV